MALYLYHEDGKEVSTKLFYSLRPLLKISVCINASNHRFIARCLKFGLSIRPQPRKTCSDMTEKLLTGMYGINTNKQIMKLKTLAES